MFVCLLVCMYSMHTETCKGLRQSIRSFGALDKGDCEWWEWIHILCKNFKLSTMEPVSQVSKDGGYDACLAFTLTESETSECAIIKHDAPL